MATVSEIEQSATHNTLYLPACDFRISCLLVFQAACTIIFVCYIHTLFCSFLQSCPAISSYSDENLDTALDLAAKNFCQQEIIVLPKNEEVYASKIFEWYESDFGKNDIEALRFVDLDLFVL